MPDAPASGVGRKRVVRLILQRDTASNAGSQICGKKMDAQPQRRSLRCTVYFYFTIMKRDASAVIGRCLKNIIAD
jgi:hypothetical protein